MSYLTKRGILLLAIFGAGCSAESADETRAVVGSVSPVLKPEEPPTVAISAQGHPKETWDAIYLRGAKVGYARTRFSEVTQDGRRLSRVDSSSAVVVQRAGQKTEHAILATGIETPEGALVRFFTQLRSGATATTFRGHVAGSELVVETETAGKTTTSRLPWPLAGGGGFLAVEQSLLRQPMQPGERRQVTGLMAVVNQPVSMELVAGKIEPTKVSDHSEDLLRIDCRAKLASGEPIVERLWATREGVILKRQIDALEQETYRTTRELALADIGPAKFDLMLDTIVKANRPLEKPHDTRRIRYRVSLSGSDPAQVFPRNDTQEVVPIDPRTAEIVVQSIGHTNGAVIAGPAGAERNAAGGNGVILASASTVRVGTQSNEAPTDDDRLPNNLVQSDYSKIVTMAESTAGDERDEWQIALRLERAAHDHMQRVSYSQALATAAEVAESGEGDCTEYAVLLAALCRARGIPARVAIGLVYVSAAQGFGYHMWNEVWIDGRWMPLDATIGQGHIGAAHLKLGHSNLKAAGAFGTFLSVAQVIGQLKIEILEVQ
jgi:hypothetical protein